MCIIRGKYVKYRRIIADEAGETRNSLNACWYVISVEPLTFANLTRKYM